MINNEKSRVKVDANAADAIWYEKQNYNNDTIWNWYEIQNDNKMINNEKSNVKADANAADAI